MSRIPRLSYTAATLASLLLVPAILTAQASPPAASNTTSDSLAYPRQFVKWVLDAQGDSAFAHAGTELREGMKSVEGINAMSLRIASRFGNLVGTDAEVQFDEGPLKVYIVAMRFSQAPEPGAWVVAYSPSTKVVERASFGSLSGVKGRYPQAKLP